MQSRKVTVYTTGAAAELLADELAALCGGCEIDDPATIDQFVAHEQKRWDYIDEQLFDNPDRPVTVSFYMEEGPDAEQLLRDVGQHLATLKQDDTVGFFGSLRVEVSLLGDIDWQNAWKAYYKPLSISAHLLVCPSWEEAEPAPDQHVLRIDPSSSFGTGSHATTGLCLQALTPTLLAGQRVLDIGCGSGILATAAMLLGAAHATACDITENAMVATAENMQRNDVPTTAYQTVQGDVLQDDAAAQMLRQAGPYRVILANIVADVLLAMRPILCDLLAPGGTLLLSGIIEPRGDEVLAPYLAAGLHLHERQARDGWVLLILKKGEQTQKNVV